MIIVMKQNFSEENLNNVINTIGNLGLTAHLSRGEHTTLIGVVGDKRKLLEKNPDLFPDVDRVIQVSETYKLANKKFKTEPTVIDVDGVKIGGDNFVIAAKNGGAQILRGGAYKPRTSPYSFQGLEVEGLKYMADAKEATGLKIITEVTSEHALEAAVNYVDIIQIGARNMQNFELLKEAGKVNKPVMLKRGLSATIDEWLNAAEYIMSEGNENVILCERGIRTFETSTRNTLDISAVPVIKSKSHLPIIVDPSHASGVREYISPLSKAAVAAGADGLMIEVHPCPEKALSDGAQSLNPKDFKDLTDSLRPFVNLVGRKF